MNMNDMIGSMLDTQTTCIYTSYFLRNFHVLKFERVKFDYYRNVLAETKLG